MNEWVQNWIVDLAKPTPANGISLCPFAQKAWDQGAVKVIATDNLWDSVHQAVQEFGEHKVVMCIQEGLDKEYFELEAECAALNRWFAFVGMDIWLLASQKEHSIVFVQRLSELNAASIALEKLGYYAQYDQADYDRLIAQRRLLCKGTKQ